MQDDEDEHQRQRHVFGQRLVGLLLALLLAEDLHRVAFGKYHGAVHRIAQRGEQLHGVDPAARVALGLHHPLAVETLDDARPEIETESVGRLLNRKDLARRIEDRQGLQIGQVIRTDVLVFQKDRHELVALAVFAQRVSLRGDGDAAGHLAAARFFWGKADGTFLNTKIFAGKYRITLKEGAFYAPEPEVVYLKENRLTRLDYSVIPYARVNIDEITLTGSKQNNLEIKYTIEDTEKEVNTEGLDEGLYTLSEAQVFISSKSPNVGVNNSETKYTIRAKKEFERGDYEPGVPFQVVEKNVRNLDPGKYWVRIGVRTANPQKRYNFSTIKEIVVPAQTAEK